MKLVSKGQPEIVWVWAIPPKLGKSLTFFFFNKWKSQSASKQLKKKIEL